MMATTFKALSALLSYPSPGLQAAVPEIRNVLTAEGLVPRRRLDCDCEERISVAFNVQPVLMGPE